MLCDILWGKEGLPQDNFFLIWEGGMAIIEENLAGANDNYAVTLT